MKNYDVHFNDNNDSNCKGFKLTVKECKNYIKMYNGTNESYFANYRSGSVSVVCNETGEIIFETIVK